MEESIRIANYIDLDVLQSMLVNLSEATGIAFVVVDITGIPVNAPVGFVEFCSSLRNMEQYRKKCYQCDAHGGLHATITGEPHIYRCHADLVDFAVPILLNGNYLGAILAGQAKVGDDAPEVMNSIIHSDVQELLKTDDNLRAQYDRVETMSYAKLRAVANTIYEISNYIVEREYVNSVKKRLQDNQLQLLQAEQNKIELEKTLKDQQLRALYYQINPHFLFNALNTICRMAYIENAEETEEIAFAFSDMMRYVIRESNIEMVRLSDEIRHCQNYLKIQQMRLKERLCYEIDIPQKYYELPCPFMILQPIVENSVKYVAEACEEGALIRIRAYENVGDLVIEISDSGEGIREEILSTLLVSNEEREAKTDSIGILNIHQRLIHTYGNDYGLEILSRPQEDIGTLVRIRIPIPIEGF